MSSIVPSEIAAEARPLQITQVEAEIPVEGLHEIAEDEIKNLKATNILTLGDLWFRIGADSAKLDWFDTVASQAKIPKDRLIALLPSRLIGLLIEDTIQKAFDTELNLNITLPPELDVRGWKRRSLTIHTIGRWLRQHLLDAILLGSLVLIGLLLLRATVSWRHGIATLGLVDGVVVTARDLKTGDVLRPQTDLSSARMPFEEKHFTTKEGLEGLILRQDISSEKPLSTDDLLRLQVVATKDISAGDQLDKNCVAEVWSPYQPAAALKSSAVIGHNTRLAIRKGNVVFSEWLEP